MKIKLVISLVLASLAFIFIYQNTEVVRVNFIVWSIEMSIVLLVFIILATGVIIGWLLNSYLRFARNRKTMKAQESIQAKEVVLPGEADLRRQGGSKAHE